MRWLSPARERAGGPVQGQVFEPDIVQEAQPVVDFAEDAGADFALLERQRLLQPGEPLPRLADGERGDIGNVVPVDPDGQRFGPQPLSGAGLAGPGCEIFRKFLADPGAVRLPQRRSRLLTTPSNGLVTR